jgi:hypothetical protein
MSATVIEAGSRPVKVTVSLGPREHGAYWIAMIPMLTVPLISGPTLVGVAVVVVSLFGFFAPEPLLVALGHRGQGARRDAPIAQSRAIGLLSLSDLAGTTALWFGALGARHNGK